MTQAVKRSELAWGIQISPDFTTYHEKWSAVDSRAQFLLAQYAHWWVWPFNPLQKFLLPVTFGSPQRCVTWLINKFAFQGSCGTLHACWSLVDFCRASWHQRCLLQLPLYASAFRDPQNCLILGTVLSSRGNNPLYFTHLCLLVPLEEKLFFIISIIPMQSRLLRKIVKGLESRIGSAKTLSLHSTYTHTDTHRNTHLSILDIFHLFRVIGLKRQPGSGYISTGYCPQIQVNRHIIYDSWMTQFYLNCRTNILIFCLGNNYVCWW